MRHLGELLPGAVEEADQWDDDGLRLAHPLDQLVVLAAAAQHERDGLEGVHEELRHARIPELGGEEVEAIQQREGCLGLFEGGGGSSLLDLLDGRNGLTGGGGRRWSQRRASYEIVRDRRGGRGGARDTAGRTF